MKSAQPQEISSAPQELGQLLIHACSRLDLPTAERLITQGANPGFKSSDLSTWRTPMDAALSAAEKAFYLDSPIEKAGELVKLLLLSGAAPSESFPDHEGASVCMRLAALGLEAELALCCGLGADLSARDATGECALAWAASHYRPICLRLLLAMGMDPAAPHCQAATAAIAADRLENLAILLSEGAPVDVECAFEEGRHELFRRALECDRPAILELLLEQGADPTFGGRRPDALESAVREFKNTEAGLVLARILSQRKANQEYREIDSALGRHASAESPSSGPRL